MKDLRLPVGEEHPWLAPLSGFSDLAFRMLCRKFGCSVAYTEMVSAKGIVYRSVGCQKIVKTCKEDFPVVVQLFGSDEGVIKDAILKLKEIGFIYFDLNSGCPVKKVIKTGAGAALLKDFKKLIHLLEEMVKVAGEGMVGVKMRTGWYRGENTFLEIGKRAGDVGLGWVVLHPRSASQKFSGVADWDQLKLLKEITSVPVIASGNIFSAEDARRCLKYTKVDGVMFARGALSNPLVFEEFIYGKKNRSLAEVLKLHVLMIKTYMGDEYHVKKLRGVISRYLKGFPYASKWRKMVISLETWEDVDCFIEQLMERDKRCIKL